MREPLKHYLAILFFNLNLMIVVSSGLVAKYARIIKSNSQFNRFGITA